MSIGKSERDIAIDNLIAKARAVITLHDEFVDNVPNDDDQAFERWSASVDDLRVALERVAPQ